MRKTLVSAETAAAVGAAFAAGAQQASAAQRSALADAPATSLETGDLGNAPGCTEDVAEHELSAQQSSAGETSTEVG